MKISICVALKNRSAIKHGNGIIENFPNMVRSIAALELRDDLELVVVDFGSQDTVFEDWLFDFGLDINLIRLDEDFSRGRGLNMAAEKAKHPYLFFNDADILIEDSAISRLIEVLDGGKSWFPEVMYTNREGKSEFTNKHGDGICAFKKEWFDQTSGVPEFYSWGGEDHIFKSRINHIVRIIKGQCQGLKHQWHPFICKSENYTKSAQSCYRKHNGSKKKEEPTKHPPKKVKLTNTRSTKPKRIRHPDVPDLKPVETRPHIPRPPKQTIEDLKKIKEDHSKIYSKKKKKTIQPRVPRKRTYTPPNLRKP